MTGPGSAGDPPPVDAALALHRGGRLVDAVAAYRRIVAFQPASAETLDLLGLAAHQLGLGGVASAALRRAIACDASVAVIHLDLALVQQAGHEIAAGRSFRHALALGPQLAKAHLGLGSMTASRDAGVCRFLRSAAVDPGYMEAQYNAGDGLIALGARSRGARAFRRALALAPAVQRAHDALAMIALGENVDTSARAMRRAFASAPATPGLLSNAATVFKEKGAIEDARRLLRRSLAREPSSPAALGNLGNVLKDVGLAADAQIYLARCVAVAPLAAHWNNYLLCMSYDPQTTRAGFFAAVRRWSRWLPKPMKPRTGTRPPGYRVSVAYLSADLRSHPMARNIAPVFEHHDRRVFRISAYTDARPVDAMTERLRSGVDDWVRIDGMSDSDVAERITADRIDILVILAGRIGANRLAVARFRPATVLATLADVDASGMEEVDCWLVDDAFLPLRAAGPRIESLALLPSYAVHTAPEGAPEVSLTGTGAADGVVFVSFNNPAKQGSWIYRMWAEILRQVPRSRLLLGFLNRYRSPSLREQVLDEMRTVGVDPGRVEFETTAMTEREHFARLGRADIALDPAPFNGSTATFEALWMGLPVVSMTGPLGVGRMGASALSRVGLAHLVADGPESYIETAVALAADKAGRAVLRRELRQRLRASPLMDAASYTRSLEGHYLRLLEHAKSR